MRKRPELLMGFNSPSDFKAVCGNADEYLLFISEGKKDVSHNTESVHSALNQCNNGIPVIPPICQSTLFNAVNANELASKSKLQFMHPSRTSQETVRYVDTS